MDTLSLLNRYQNLSPSAQNEVADFIEFLLSKYKRIESKPKNEKQDAFSFSWEGSLSEYKNKYTSVELQHKANEWRNI